MNATWSITLFQPSIKWIKLSVCYARCVLITMRPFLQLIEQQRAIYIYNKTSAPCFFIGILKLCGYYYCQWIFLIFMNYNWIIIIYNFGQKAKKTHEKLNSYYFLPWNEKFEIIKWWNVWINSHCSLKSVLLLFVLLF